MSTTGVSVEQFVAAGVPRDLALAFRADAHALSLLFRRKRLLAADGFRHMDELVSRHASGGKRGHR